MSGTKIKAELILASKNAATGDILYSFRLTYPRIILAEFLTHRVFSRNTSSSRAIPGKRYRKVVKDDPFVPVYIGAAQKGMQAGAELTGWRRKGVELIWRALRYPALLGAWGMETLGAHKQVANRVLEPWTWVTQVASTTDIKNFLKLRAHEMAEPHFQVLARQIAELVKATDEIFDYFGVYDGGLTGRYENRQILQPGEWHLPFITEEEHEEWVRPDLRCISAARCARTSYTLIGSKNHGAAADLSLGRDLIKAEPLHASPVEHQALALTSSQRVGNFKGFMQWRKTFMGEQGGD